jgi:hypothetical protein
MKKYLTRNIMVMICFILSLTSGSILAQNEGENQSGLEKKFVGVWLGALKTTGSGELRVVFRIQEGGEGKLVAFLDSPDGGVTGIPVDEVTLEGVNLRLVIKSIGSIFDGTINVDGSIIEGEWTQENSSFPLTLKRVENVPETLRSQEPQKPYPYQEKEVFYDNTGAGIELAGTLTFPGSGGPFPAVLLIQGSGPQDRNGSVFGHHKLLVLADYLTRSGLAVLRFDKRGVGGSTGEISGASYPDLSGDVMAGIEYLKSRKEIDSKRIGLVGHDEGGIIAQLVAAESPDVAFMVMMAGPGIKGDKERVLQMTGLFRAGGAGEEKVAALGSWLESMFAVVNQEKDDSIAATRIRELYVKMSLDDKKLLGLSKVVLEGEIRQFLGPYFRETLSYDPGPVLMKVKCPVLAIIGSKDLQVPSAENLPAIQEALDTGGNRNYTVKELPNLNHQFQTAETGTPNEYAKIEETISPEALKFIADWIVAQTGNKTAGEK